MYWAAYIAYDRKTELRIYLWDWFALFKCVQSSVKERFNTRQSMSAKADSDVIIILIFCRRHFRRLQSKADFTAAWAGLKWAKKSDHSDQQKRVL